MTQNGVGGGGDKYVKGLINDDCNIYSASLRQEPTSVRLIGYYLSRLCV